MGQFDFTYTLPTNFESRIRQVLMQQYSNAELAAAFSACKYECEDIGNAYYNGMKGDNWNKNAVDFTIEGSHKDIELLIKEKAIIENTISIALHSSISGMLLHNTVFLASDDTLLYPSTDKERLNTDIRTAESVLIDILHVGERLCSNVTYNKDSSENSINDFMRDALSFLGYDEIKDQTRHGLSKSEKDAGEVDILITKSGKETAIYEGLKLSSVDTSYIDGHITKAIINYNALGTATFIVAYVSVADYATFWSKYQNYLLNYEYPLKVKGTLKARTLPNAAERVASLILSRDGYDFPVYFLTLKLSK